MARSNRHHRFTVFDMMEAKGVFEDNKNNADSPDYDGPMQYPKMFYHPEGKERITVPAEIISTPLGPKEVGQQTEIIHEVATNAAHEKKLREDGWHDHPAKALMAAGKDAPPISSAARIDDLEAQIRKLQAELDGSRAEQLSEVRSVGQIAPPRRGKSLLVEIEDTARSE